MSDPFRTSWLDEIRAEFRRQKGLADGAIAQVDEAAMIRAPDHESNSIAILMRHMAGNMRSRWIGFFSTDGEKPDRHRDAEFTLPLGLSRSAMVADWESGWAAAFKALDALQPEDLDRQVRIRGEPHSVARAVNRQLTHYAYHVGQIVLLARHWCGTRWRTLSIPLGQSEQFTDRVRQQYGR